MSYEIRYKIKELRKLNNLTQRQIAEALNKSVTAVASWEQGLSEPNVNDIRKLCSIFQVSADEMLGVEDEKIDT